MTRAPLLGSLLLSVMLAGCFGGGDDEGPDGSPTGTPEPAPVTVEILNFTETVEPNGTVEVSWRVDPGNQTTVNITHTAVHWADFSVDDPETPADYGNTSGEHLATAPGTFNASFELDVNESVETIYLRAHANVEGQNHWSDEVQITVEPNLTPSGEEHMVEITGPGALSEYDPDPLTISVGDAVVWKNVDATNFQHTATSDDSAPASFDTGALPRDEVSEPIVFTTPGTYEYHCTFHPTTMQGMITVQQ